MFADLDQRAFYASLAETRKMPVFACIMADYLNPPIVDAIDLTGYQGQLGQFITVRASDDGAVTGVTVVLRGLTGLVVEEGPATYVNGLWRYTATTTLAPEAGVFVEAAATDRPGHTGVKIIRYN